jgi:8-oxo-dGTP diphosphatase
MNIKEVDIVVGLCERGGRFLFLQRKDVDVRWDKKWEFPGGKIDAGESPDDAIVREVLEETGLRVLRKQHVLTHVHDWKKPDEILRVTLQCYYCEMDDGEVVREEDKTHMYTWATSDESLNLDSLEANTDILTKFFNEILPNLDRGE